MENQGSFLESATGKEAEKSTSRAFATRAKNTWKRGQSNYNISIIV